MTNVPLASELVSQYSRRSSEHQLVSTQHNRDVRAGTPPRPFFFRTQMMLVKCWSQRDAPAPDFFFTQPPLGKHDMEQRFLRRSLESTLTLLRIKCGLARLSYTQSSSNCLCCDQKVHSCGGYSVCWTHIYTTSLTKNRRGATHHLG